MKKAQLQPMDSFDGEVKTDQNGDFSQKLNKTDIKLINNPEESVNNPFSMVK